MHKVSFRLFILNKRWSYLLANFFALQGEAGPLPPCVILKHSLHCEHYQAGALEFKDKLGKNIKIYTHKLTTALKIKVYVNTNPVCSHQVQLCLVFVILPSSSFSSSIGIWSLSSQSGAVEKPVWSTGKILSFSHCCSQRINVCVAWLIPPPA